MRRQLLCLHHDGRQSRQLLHKIHISRRNARRRTLRYTLHARTLAYYFSTQPTTQSFDTHTYHRRLFSDARIFALFFSRIPDTPLHIILKCSHSISVYRLVLAYTNTMMVLPHRPFSFVLFTFFISFGCSR